MSRGRSLSAGTWVGGALLALFLFVAIFGPLLCGQSPTAQDLDHPFAGPSWRHLLGTDENGCDLLAEMCHGARLAALISLSVVGTCLVTGGLIGTAAGYFGGLVDEVVMRIIDVFLAFPGILLNIVIVAVARKPGLAMLGFALCINGWVGYARVARGQALQVREREFVLAARALGAGPGRIIFRHVVPNLLSPLIVQASFGFAGVVLVEASLSFLGLGPAIPYTWGALLLQGTTYSWRTQHLLVVPGLAIAVLVLGANLLGDGLRDYLDPRRARG